MLLQSDRVSHCNTGGPSIQGVPSTSAFPSAGITSTGPAYSLSDSSRGGEIGVLFFFGFFLK